MPISLKVPPSSVILLLSLIVFTNVLPVLIILLLSLSTISTKSPTFKLDGSVLLSKLNWPSSDSEKPEKLLK